MAYWIRQDDITNFFYFSSGIIAQTSDGAGKIATAFNSFSGMTSFSGSAADSIKAYISEVHLSALLSIGEIFTEFNSKMLLYRDGYYSIDDSAHAQLHEDALAETETFFMSHKANVLNKSDELQSILNGIAEIFSCAVPSVTAVEDDCTQTIIAVNQLNQSVGEYEQTHLSDFDNLDKMIAALQSFIENYSQRHSITAYQAGDVLTLPSFTNLLPALALLPLS